VSVNGWIITDGEVMPSWLDHHHSIERPIDRLPATSAHHPFRFDPLALPKAPEDCPRRRNADAVAA